MTDSFSIMHADTLLWMLSAFAEPVPTARDIFVQRLTALRRQGLSNKTIGEILGKTGRCVAVWVHNLDLPRRALKVYPFSDRVAQCAVIKDLWLAGYLPHEIGQKVGIPSTLVYQRAQRMKLPRMRGKGSNKFCRKPAA